MALLDIDIQEGRRAVAGLVDSFPEKTNSIIFQQLDVTNGAAVQAVTSELSESLDWRPCFAGIANVVRMADYTPESFWEILDVNTPGTFLNAQAIVKYVICRQL